MQAEFSARMMGALSFLQKGLLSEHSFTLPQVNSWGEEIKTLDELSAVMGIDKKIAAAYAVTGKNGELKAEAEEVLSPGIYNAFEDGYEPVVHYAYQIADKTYIEPKALRMVRNASGARYFGLAVGSIIVSDSEKPLDGLMAITNDVPGYQKVTDHQGNAYYIGHEGNGWVVRSATTKQVMHATDKAHGEQELLYWLNEHVGGRGRGKSISGVETKGRYTTLTVQKMSKRGHAFRNQNGTYSYPISTVADLKDAIMAFGRSAEEDRERLKAYIKKHAKQLKRPDLIPDDWKTGVPMDLEAKRFFIEIDDDGTALDVKSTLDTHPGANWVETEGGLPKYIVDIAKALVRDHGFTVSHAIQTAINRVKKWASGVGNVNPDTRAKAAAAVAEWEKLKSKAKARPNK